ncbi:hypothetical protein QFC22_004819 [Naganishia vaughanmartiniae]|uniref:Uncharacterized protein n=1 Tax=Naganishia vaughanmartiniae TaxID=1424756 RepID=A0ACC2WX81_9TREE|nr:hypothetical protein QFC22_004819 [Naganishia vaughanmartiniae]
MADSENSHVFTCISCAVAFNDPALQRQHFASDWHRYNMKRRVALLPPVSAQSFNTKVIERREQTAVKPDPRSMQCDACRKVFATENAYRTHITSKKHRITEAKWAEQQAGRVKMGAEENVPGEHEQQQQMQFEQEGADEEPEAVEEETAQQAEASTAKAPTPEADQPMEEVVEEEEEPTLEESIDAKLARARGRIPPNGCLFCTHLSDDIEANLSHMAVKHSFFLPDTEYLVDVEGLLQYLGEKIAIGNVCLYCPANIIDEDGHPASHEFGSLEAVRAHMNAKGHCKLAYDTEWERQEISEYYDFEASYPDADERRERRKAREERRAERAETRTARAAKRNAKAEQDAADGWEEVADDGAMVEDVDEVVEEAESEPESDVSQDTDEDDESDFEESGAALAPDGLSLRLPSGRTLGHRSLRVYYNQHLRPLPDAETPDESNPSTAVTIKLRAIRQRLADPTLAIIPVSGGAGGFGRGLQTMNARNAGEARWAKNMAKENRDFRKRELHKTRVAIKVHNSQKHFRDPLLQ